MKPPILPFRDLLRLDGFALFPCPLAIRFPHRPAHFPVEGNPTLRPVAEPLRPYRLRPDPRESRTELFSQRRSVRSTQFSRPDSLAAKRPQTAFARQTTLKLAKRLTHPN